jgi:hypothetical protein
MKIEQAFQLATILKNKQPELHDWRIRFNKQKKSFGLCDYDNKTIELSIHFIPYCTYGSIINTIIHEIAHALLPDHNHDDVWKNKCIELGGDGKRCGNRKDFISAKSRETIYQNISKYTLTCPKCGYKYFKHRKPIDDLCCGWHDKDYSLIVTKNY